MTLTCCVCRVLALDAWGSTVRTLAGGVCSLTVNDSTVAAVGAVSAFVAGAAVFDSLSVSAAAALNSLPRLGLHVPCSFA